MAGGGTRSTAGRARRRLGEEDGNTVILTLVFMASLFVIGLVALNAAVLFGARASIQRAADASALAGCFDLPNASRASSNAVRYGSSSGGLNATGAINLESGKGDQVAAPVVTATGTLSERTGEVLQNDQIEVDVDRTQELVGAPSSGFTDRGVGARAVCTRDEGPISVLTALSGSLEINQSSIDVGENGIMACSADADALSITGSTVEARFIDTGSGTGSRAGSSVTPWPPTQRDDCDETHPFALVSIPEPPGGPIRECEPVFIPIPVKSCFKVGSGQTLDSGVYPGGVELGSPILGTPFEFLCFLFPFLGFLCQDTDVTLNCVTDPCVFYMAGGGFEVNGRTTVTGSGAIIRNGPGGSGTCGSIDLRSTSDLLVTPPTGTYDGLIVYQDAECEGAMRVERGALMGASASDPGGIFLPGAALTTVEPFLFFTRDQTTFHTIIVAQQIQIDQVSQSRWPRDFLPSGTVHHGDYNLVE